MNRSERRRLARRNARELGARMEQAAEGGDLPVGFFSATGESVYVGDQGADLPDRVFGHHRWIATAGYVLDDDAVRTEMRAQGGSGERQYLDHTRLFMFGIACYDCERPLGDISPDSFCAGDPNDPDPREVPDGKNETGA